MFFDRCKKCFLTKECTIWFLGEGGHGSLGQVIFPPSAAKVFFFFFFFNSDGSIFFFFLPHWWVNFFLHKSPFRHFFFLHPQQRVKDFCFCLFVCLFFYKKLPCPLDVKWCTPKVFHIRLFSIKGPYADHILIPQGSTGSSIFFDIKWKPIFFWLQIQNFSFKFFVVLEI